MMNVYADTLLFPVLVSTLWRASWQGALVLFIVGLVCRAFARRLPADAHCWLWRLGYAKFLLGLVWGGAVLLPLLSPISQPPVPHYYTVASSSAVVSLQSSAEVPAVPAVVRPNGKVNLSWQVYLAIAYGMGVAFCSIRLLLATRRTRRVLESTTPAAGPEAACAEDLARRIGLRSVPLLARSAAVDSPVLVAGTILLPAEAEYEEADMRMILAHELAHVKRWDLLWEWLGTLIQIAFFFHPLVVLARREERLAREAAADVLALQATETDAADYGKLLLSLSLQQNHSRPHLVGAVGVIEGGTLLHRRLLALRDGAARTSAARNQRRIAAVLAPLIALVFVPWKITHGQTPTSALVSAPGTPDDAPKMPAGNKQITGIVMDEQGQPVTKIGVSLTWYWSRIQNGEHSSGSRPLRPPVFADAQGRFKFSGLPSGKFQYGVYSLDGRYVTILSPLIIHNNETTKTLRVVVSTGSLVTGRVVDGQTGKPMAGILVGAGSIPPGSDLAKWNFWELPSEGQTDAEGRYQVRVMPGDNFVGVGRITNNTLASRRISPSVRRVTTMWGQTASAPDLPVFLYPLFVCVGPDDQPAANAKMHVVPINMPKYNYTLDDYADSTGTIVLDRIEAGMFSIAQGSRHASGTYRWSPGQPLVVTMNGETRSYPDGVAQVSLAEEPAASTTRPAVLTGTVVSEVGKPVSNALIDVVYTNPKNQQVMLEQAFRTDDAGLVRGTLAPIGNYAVSYVRADGFSEVFPPEKPQAVVPGTTASLGTVQLVQAEGFISGRVVDSAGRPISGAVAWVEGGKTIFSAASTDDTGYFRIPNVVMGDAVSLGLCRNGTVRDSGTVITEDKERMKIPGVEASLINREIVWKPSS